MFLSSATLQVVENQYRAMPETVKVDLAFEGIHMTLATNNNDNGQRVLLDGSLRGRAQPGRMLAIMGPSGAVRHECVFSASG